MASCKETGFEGVSRSEYRSLTSITLELEEALKGAPEEALEETPEEALTSSPPFDCGPGNRSLSVYPSK
jgi:hypothetical protein